MSWGAVIGAAAGLIGSQMSSNAAKKGADAQVNAANYAADLQDRQFQQTRQDMMPWLDAGSYALQQQRNFLAGDYGAAMNSPDYLAARDQGLKALDRGNAANLSLVSGGADADRIQFASNLATQQIGNHYNRLAGLSGTGQTTAGQLGQFGANAANQMGNNALTGANARASSYAASSNAWNNGLNQTAGWAQYAIGNLGRDDQGYYLGKQRGRG